MASNRTSQSPKYELYRCQGCLDRFQSSNGYEQHTWRCPLSTSPLSSRVSRSPSTNISYSPGAPLHDEELLDSGPNRNMKQTSREGNIEGGESKNAEESIESQTHLIQQQHGIEEYVKGGTENGECVSWSKNGVKSAELGECDYTRQKQDNETDGYNAVVQNDENDTDSESVSLSEWENDQSEEDDALGELINPRSNDPMKESQYSTSIPNSGFLSSFNSNPFRGPISVRESSLGSVNSFYTAHSSLASYITAPRSFSFRNSPGNKTKRIIPKRGFNGFYASSGSIPSDQLSTSNNATLQATEKEVSSSVWLEHLKASGIFLDPKDELDWSGRGQHVEYGAEEELYIPLTAEKILGHSATAIVESVMCRRIRLARKRIRCNRRLTREEAITEVKHLQLLQHSHIIRVVGTYTYQKYLAILLYPAAEWDLEEFMEDVSDVMTIDIAKETALVSFFECLANAVDFMHAKCVKHMDLKPKNLLIRTINQSKIWPQYKIYVADFGIARAYKSAAESETDSPTSFTRRYAAPEVVSQNIRGFSADIFSLGCIYLEMFATTYPKARGSGLRELRRVCCNPGTGDTSYQANTQRVKGWYRELVSEAPRYRRRYVALDNLTESFIDMVPDMVDKKSSSRPTANRIKSAIGLCCESCNDGPEPFQAAT